MPRARPSHVRPGSTCSPNAAATRSKYARDSCLRRSRSASRPARSAPNSGVLAFSRRTSSQIFAAGPGASEEVAPPVATVDDETDLLQEREVRRDPALPHVEDLHEVGAREFFVRE